MKRGTLILFFYFHFLFRSFGSSSPNLTIAVLTLEPGTDIYTVFGHTAIRITDSANHRDEVYNFGTFNFYDPFFFLKFARGDLRYFLSVVNYDDFQQEIILENRTVHEQVLDFTQYEKRLMEERLITCYNSEDRYYTYDFFSDNCATRVKDYVFNSPGHPVTYDTSVYYGQTFRQLLYPYISHNYWLTLGINLGLGKEADRIARSEDYMFLPYYIRDILNKTELVISDKILLQAKGSGRKYKILSWVSPWVIFSILMLLLYREKTRHYSRKLLALTMGITGVVLLITGIITVNQAITDNYNTYWLIPSFVLLLKKNRLTNILKSGYLLFLTMILLFWNHLPQAMSLTFLPWIAGVIIVLFVDLDPFKIISPIPS
jgi:hypothetical protein